MTRRAWLLDGALALACLAVSLVVLVLDDPGPAHWPAALRAGTGVLSAVALLLRRRYPFWALAAAVLDGVALGEVGSTAPFAAYAIIRYGPVVRGRLALAAAGLLVLMPWNLHQGRTLITNNALILALLIVLPAVLAAWVRTRAELVDTLRERAERAEREQRLLAREAVLAERSRIAREMHDVVGHRVSLMVLQAGAIDMAAEDPVRVRVLTGQLEDAGRRSLTELRQLLGLLADEQEEDAPLAPQPGLADVDELVANVQRAGMTVTLAREGADREIDPTVGRTAYRVIQEALTNSGKHAPGGPVTVTLRREPDALTVTIVNGRATRPPARLPGGGLGLIGLRERARTVGGTVRAEPRLDGGFGVEAVLPC